MVDIFVQSKMGDIDTLVIRERENRDWDTADGRRGSNRQRVETGTRSEESREEQAPIRGKLICGSATAVMEFRTPPWLRSGSPEHREHIYRDVPARSVQSIQPRRAWAVSEITQLEPRRAIEGAPERCKDNCYQIRRNDAKHSAGTGSTNETANRPTTTSYWNRF